MRSRWIVVAILMLSGAVLPGCAAGEEETATTVSALDDGAVTVASFDFAESVLLGELYAQALEAAGLEVHRALDLGPRELVAPAMVAGLVELVPEYAGSALRFIRMGVDVPAVDAEATHALLLQALEPHPVTALAAAPAENANAFVVTRQTAEEKGLRTISDLEPLAADLTFGGPPECPTRSLCLVGLEQRYGIDFGTVVALDAGGPMTRQALLDGGVDVALLFSSDPSLGPSGFLELVDDHRLQPAENITPLVRTEVVERWGDDLVTAVDAVSARLTEAELRQLNSQLAAGTDPATVASRWLRKEGLT